MIVVFGSFNVDLLIPVERLPKAGETVLGPSYSFAAGGKGANQALACARAGAEVHMVGRVGGDDLSEIALHDLRASGVDLSLTGKDEKPTGLAAICIDKHGENIIVVASGANRNARADQVPDHLLTPKSIVLLQMEVPVEENWALVRRAKARGARVMLNVAPAAAVPTEIVRALDWLVVNEIEAMIVAESLGAKVTLPRDAAREIATIADAAVIVTLGGDGACAFADGRLYEVAALKITPVDTVGAGDAFVGALAAAIDCDRDLGQGLAYGSVAGALACLVPGAQPSLPTKAAIEARLKDLPPVKVWESRFASE
ncbi:MAG TPA: ribokinase [Candidatus Binatia bacterium]|nr:ribokinase [Candidatus Binatia bacterium]